MKKILVIMLLALGAMTMMAQGFKIGKLTFAISSPTEVELSSATVDITALYLGETIDYQGKIYTVTEIADYAFYGCSLLTSVTIPNSVTRIGNEAFYGCSSLTSINISNSVTEIGWGALDGTAFYNNRSNWENGALYLNDCLIAVDTNFVGHFKMKDNTRVISASAFAGCSSLTSVTIPNSVTSIGASAFYGCSSMTSIIIPNSVTSIGDEVFSGCTSLTSVTIHNSVTSIGWVMFSGCTSLTSITIPNSVTSIGDEAFSGCSSMTSITIPNSVTVIGTAAFSGCTSLTSITIPNSVTVIGSGVFYDSSSLTAIDYAGTKAQWDKIDTVESGAMDGSAVQVIRCTDGELAINR